MSALEAEGLHSRAGESFTWGGGGWALGAPQNFWGGGAERGSKGHKLISSIQMPEILPPTISKCCGLFSSCVAYGHYLCDWVCRSPGLHFKFGKEYAAIDY